MNPDHSSSPPARERSNSFVFFSVTAGFLIFAALLLFLFASAGKPANHDDTRALDRAKKLETLRAQEDKELRETGWIDEKSGVARIPIDRAMDLELETLRNKPIRAAAPIQPQDLNPTLIKPPSSVPKP